MLDLESVGKALPGLKLSPETAGDSQTLAGFMMKAFGHVPKEGETIRALGYNFEVIDMDRHRIDKVLITPAPRGA
jgi:putative hemolysin